MSYNKNIKFASNGKQLELTLKTLTAVAFSDADNQLFKNNTYTAENTKEFFTREEIREQFVLSFNNVCNSLLDCGFDIDTPIVIIDNDPKYKVGIKK